MSELVKYLRIESFEPEKEKFLTSEVLNKLDRQYLDTKINVENLMLCVISHTFENSILPIDFDTYFNDRTFQDYTLNSITVRGCFNYGNKFHTELWKGYNHLAIIEIDGDINLFEKQIKSYKTKHRWDSNLIVCQSVFCFHLSILFQFFNSRN